MPEPANDSSFFRTPIAIVLAWLIPGLGHIYLGDRRRGGILCATVTLTFLIGIAIGGVTVVSPVKPSQNVVSRTGAPVMTSSWWFFAQALNGSYAVVTYQINKAVTDGNPTDPRYYLAWPSGDVGSVYTGIAGLLNLLIILDVLVRASGTQVPLPKTDPSGSPHHPQIRS